MRRARRALALLAALVAASCGGGPPGPVPSPIQTASGEPRLPLVTAAGVLIASFKALAEWRRATEQRREELEQRQREFRDKQAAFARELTREVFADPKARAPSKCWTLMIL